MKYKYYQGNGLENSHAHDHVRTHIKEKDGLECGCKHCQNPDEYYSIDVVDMVWSKYQKSNYHFNKLSEYLIENQILSGKEIMKIIK